MANSYPMLLKNRGATFTRFIEVSPTLMARDYKGFNTYGMAGVLEIIRGGGRIVGNR